MTDTSTQAEIRKWFNKQVPDSWFTQPLETLIDRDEILVIGELAAPDGESAADYGAADDSAADDSAADVLAAKESIVAFREDTRDRRVAIAARAEALFGRKVSWAVTCGRVHAPFTTLSIPVMTRLRMDQRRILDTLVGAGVARSRSDALGWCVSLVAEHEADWLSELEKAVAEVAKVRRRGPT